MPELSFPLGPEGDDGAMARVYHQQYETLHAFVRRVVPLEDCDDVIHAALAKYYQRLRSGRRVRPAPDLRVALFTMVIDCTRDYRKKQKRERRALQLVTGPRAAVRRWMAAHRSQEDGEISRLVREVLDEMRPAWRDTFLMVRRHGFEVAEAARILGVKEVTVRSHVHRASTLLRDALTKAGYAPARATTTEDER